MRRARRPWFLVLITVIVALGPVCAQDTESDVPRYAAKLSAYEPSYFALGWRGRTNARFQLSFKYRFLNAEGSLARSSAFLRDLHFGYTQSSLWDLESDSEPFRDSSYKPSLFYLKKRISTSARGISRYDLQVGFEHESNGKDEPDSRTINIAYVRPALTFGNLEEYHFTLAPKIWAYIGSRAENPEIAHYRGYMDLHLAYLNRESWKFAANVRRGSEKHYGSVQIDVTYPLDRVMLRNLDAYLHIQYFNGWGESILDYNRKFESQFRFGLMVVR